MASVTATLRRRTRLVIRSIQASRWLATRVHTVQVCPEPRCWCDEDAPNVSLLDIDRNSYLDDTVPPYREQVVICTGVTSWEPKIDDENNKDNLARDISQMLKKAGEDLPNDARLPRITVLNASFPSSWSKRRAIPSNSVYLFPSFKYVPRVIRTRPDFDTDPTHLQRSIFSAEALMERCVLPYFPKSHMTPNFLHDGIRHDVYMEFDKNLQDVEDVVVLICGHDRVDWRCGVMGPLLVREFNNQLVKAGLDVRDDRVFVPKSGSWKDYRSKRGDVVQAARVGLVSHVGGHKFAGNVIIYLPPDMKMNEKPHPLAGHGVWYGRVEMRNVEGLIQETILGGKIVVDKFRGGITPDRKMLKLAHWGKLVVDK